MDTILNKIKIPNHEERVKDTDTIIKSMNKIYKEENIGDLFRFEAWTFTHLIPKSLNYPKFDGIGAAKLFEEFEESKICNIMTYRDQVCKNLFSGEYAPKCKVGWL